MTTELEQPETGRFLPLRDNGLTAYDESINEARRRSDAFFANLGTSPSRMRPCAIRLSPSRPSEFAYDI